MCTAITFHGKEFYFGRTLDHARSYGEEVVLAPRNFPLPFREAEDLPRHLAIMGMAHVEKGYPLFYDAMNEAGLCMAGLNFTGFARYGHPGRQFPNKHHADIRSGSGTDRHGPSFQKGRRQSVFC